MTDINRLYDALRNADAAGDTQAAARLAQFIREQQGQPQPQPQPMSRAEKIGAGVADPIHGGAQLLTQMLPEGVVKAGNRFNNWLADTTGLVAKLPEGGVDQQVREREAEYQNRRAAAGESGIDGYRMLGNVISPANLALAKLAPLKGALATKMAVGAGVGATSAALAPVTQGDFADEKQKQVTIGGIFGAATPAVTQGVSRVISPKSSVNPDLKLLRDGGVKPTIGQTLGGTANKLEEKATSLPFVGDAIAAKRRSAVEQFNNMAINRATKPIGVRVEGSGTQAVKQAADAVSDAYTTAKNQLGAFQLDKQANTDLSRLRMLASTGMEGKERATFNRFFTDYISGNKAFTAEKFKELDSVLGKRIEQFSKGDAYQQNVADAFKEMQRILLDAAKRANPNAAKALSAADEAYANLVRIEGASVAGKAADGIFTPGQLMTAVRGADKSARDRATAQGRALMQDLAGAGQRVLGNTVPDSGTAGRLLGAGGLGYGVATDPLLTGAGVLGGMAIYSRPLQGLLNAAISSRPQSAQAVSNALQQTSPRLIPAGSQIGLGLLY